MSLKVEQILDNFFITENEPRIYTTGAYLVPLEIKRGNESRYVWVVDDFNDETYFDGALCDPNVEAEKIENLINLPEFDE